MPLTDLVPCFYAGQPRILSRPAKLMLRSNLHDMKKHKLGLFVDDGTAFQFTRKFTDAVRPLWDGLLGVGNLLPFARLHNYGDKLHYWAGPQGLRFHGLYQRRDENGVMQLHSHEIEVSSRLLFSQPGMQWKNYA